MPEDFSVAQLELYNFLTGTHNSGWDLLAQQTQACKIKIQGPQDHTLPQLGMMSGLGHLPVAEL